MLQINDELNVYRNQLDREAIVLAVWKHKALIEYTMPNGTSALNIIASDDVDGEGRLQICELLRPDAALVEHFGRPVSSVGRASTKRQPVPHTFGCFEHQGRCSMSIQELREELVRAMSDADLNEALQSFIVDTPLYDACLTEALVRCK